MTATTPSRIFNFSAGPSNLPLEVLEQAAAEMTHYADTGMSLLEMSHRSKPVVAIFDEAVALMREILSLPDDVHVLFLAGGATLTSGMIPLNLLQGGKSADYTHSGAWAKKSIADAKAVGSVNLVFDGTDSNFTTLPDPATLQTSDDAVYLHITSNETIGGLQWKAFPSVDAPVVADMSSDILSRPIDFAKTDLVYAGAQKNVGPAGLGIVLVKQGMLDLAHATTKDALPNYLNLARHAKNNSMLNTPPVFQVYIVKLVLEWLKAKGGVAWASQQADAKSKLLYDAVDRNAGFYNCPVDQNVRSNMNVVFTTPSEDLDAAFVKEAADHGMGGLKGHRSVGGCRASVYNAMPVEGAEALATFMDEFAAKNG